MRRRRFRRIATVRKIGSGAFRKPVSAGGAASGWAGETESRPETQSPDLELLDFPAGELYAMPAATQALLDDTVADVDAWLAEEVRDVFSAQESAAFVVGDGSKKPRGFLDYAQVDDAAHTWGTIGTVSTGVDGFDPTAPLDAVMDLIYAPKSRYRAGSSFVMNRRTLSAMRKFKDADGNYVWQPAARAGQASTLLGYPVVEMEDMPDVAAGATTRRVRRLPPRLPDRGPPRRAACCAIRTPPSLTCCSTRRNASAAACRTSPRSSC